jgi:hypothetical protein
MKAGRLVIVIVCIDLLTCVGTILADGCMFIRHATRADILQPTQKVYIRWDGSQEKLLIQTKYEGPAEEMVWIVPVPSQPTVEAGDPNVFEQLSIDTYSPDLSYTDFVGLRVYSAGIPRTRDGPVEWRRQIGAYDVVLLRPVGEETVIEWLNANEFGVPDKAVSVLEDYIREQWWMVAAKIHPDSLTDITREKLAQGLLHPLEMTFASPACLYPLRLTSIAAGPVEELIYIEGPTHYEPMTFADDKWTIDIFGGPVCQVLDSDKLRDVEVTGAIVEGRTQTIFKRYLAKLRRVFQPDEMTKDIVFTKMDYAKLVASETPMRIAQGATQYGRQRDPNGISPLSKALAPTILDQVKPAPEEHQPFPNPSAQILLWQGIEYEKSRCMHVRSCIWALGEIAIDHNVAPDVNEALLRCAKHENQLIRMEAYIALIKARCHNVGPVLFDQITRILDGNLAYLAACHWPEDQVGITEAGIIADWLDRYGTADERNAWLNALSDAIANLPREPICGAASDEWGNAGLDGWPGWMVWRAIEMGDGRFISPLQSLRAKLPDTSSLILFLLKAEALCGSPEAVSSAARWMADAQSRVLPGLQGATKDGYARLTPMGQPGRSLRDQILRVGAGDYADSGVLSTISDTILRTAISDHSLDDWYVLYLLAQIEHPQASDKEIIRNIWDTKDEGKRLVAVDILWLWEDAEMMLALYEQCNQSKVRFEIERLVLDLERRPHR